MHDWWTLPLDRDAFIGEIPDVTGFKPRSNFGNELIRKLYSFNGTNGPISYVGWINGYRVLHESANAFRPFFQQIQEESSFGLVKEYGFDQAEQEEFMALAMKKYADPALNDPIERNAKDLSRKLGKDERLVGPARLCLKHGKKPEAYAIAIAAAYCYTGSEDPGTTEVVEYIAENGIGKAVEKFSGLAAGSELYEMVLDAYRGKKWRFPTVKNDEGNHR
jgi:mannitol-1-phosphate 5-dehydrogenase